MNNPLPDQLVSPEVKKQFLDFYILNEMINNFPEGFIIRIQENLNGLGIDYSKSLIERRIHAIRSGKVVPKPAADFYNIPGRRFGKDQNYAGFWALADVAIPRKENRHYIGLSANQFPVIHANHINGSMLICEMNKDVYEKLLKIREGLKWKYQVEIKRADIFDQMNDKSNYYNVFDLDLMCILPDEDEMDYWVESIYNAALTGQSVINITTIIGHGLTETQYRGKLQNLLVLFLQHNLRIVGKSEFAYRDRQSPMRSIRLIIEK